jgi:hypothetical protein
VPLRTHRAATWSVAVASLALLVASCSSDGGSDPEQTGPTDQAVERLHDFGLTKEQAGCIVDEIGAEAVVEASDLNALTESQQYRDAAEACLDEG